MALLAGAETVCGVVGGISASSAVSSSLTRSHLLTLYHKTPARNTYSKENIEIGYKPTRETILIEVNLNLC